MHMFYEMRIYDIARGRSEDMLERYQNGLDEIFPRHGYEVVAAGRVLEGEDEGAFLYVMRWTSLDARIRALDAFAADPAWHELRERSNRGAEFLQHYSLSLSRAFHGEVNDFASSALREAALFEFREHRLTVGKVAAFREQLAEEQQKITAAGGMLVSAWDALTGSELPTAYSVIAWPAHEMAQDLTASSEAQRGLRIWRVSPVWNGTEPAARASA